MAASQRIYTYLLRCALLFLAIGLLLKTLLTELYGPGRDHTFNAIIGLVGQMDVIRSVFYAAIPAAMLLLLMPRISNRISAYLRLPISGALGIACGALIVLAPLYTRPGAGIAFWPLASGIYIAINVSGFCWLQLKDDDAEPLLGIVARAIILSDLLLPALLWQACFRSRSSLLRPTRILPAVIVCMAGFLPWLISPMPISESLRTTEELKALGPGPLYQVLIDTRNNSLITTDIGSRTLRRIPLDAAGSAIETRMESCEGLQAVALDDQTDKLAVVDVDADTTFVIDARTLEVLQKIPIEPAQDILGNCRTLWLSSLGLLVAHCETGVYSLCADGRTLKAHYPGLPGDLLYDAERNELILAAWGQPLTALDPETLKPVRSLSVPNVLERMAVDPPTQRLFLALPMHSTILVVDLQDFEVLHSIRAFPGVRLAAVDRARGWLVLGGLSPVLEIRSLHDYKPIHRLTAPPWMRWFQIDSAAGKAYLTSCSHGLWELDLEALADKGPAPFVARHDPFYRLAALLADAVQTSLGWDSDVLEFQPTEPAIFNAAPCPDGSWTDPPPAENESSLPAATD